MFYIKCMRGDKVYYVRWAFKSLFNDWDIKMSEDKKDEAYNCINFNYICSLYD